MAAYSSEREHNWAVVGVVEGLKEVNDKENWVNLDHSY
jgi:hypothetical protein